MNKNKYLRIFVLCVLTFPAVAAEYPERPVRVVVEFPAGGATDVVARRVGNKLRERIGQQIVIDNRAGAGGLIAHEFVAKSPADGYTLLMASTAFAANKFLHRKLAYDAATDFMPVALLADSDHSPQLCL